MKFTLTVFTLVIITSSVIAQPHTYPDYKTLKGNLEKITNDHPKLVQLESLGTTTDGRQVLLLKLGSGEKDAKPAVLLVAGVNGPDLSGTEIIMQFIQSSVNNYGKIDSITYMLDHTTFYIFPRVNPDATEGLFSSPVYARTLNNRSLDLDRDGKVDEDGYEDLNKDGLITQMRITESGGEWIKDKDYPGLLRRADQSEDEAGVYRLIREGFDNDGDGKLNEDESGGANFNKNFTYNYKYFGIGSGVHQISEIESRAVADFAFAHSNIAAVFSFSQNDNLIIPWEPSKKAKGNDPKKRGQQPVTSVDKIDAPYYKYISDKFKKITGIINLPEVESGTGAFSEWAYYHYGRWSFSTPAWTPPLIESQKDSSMKVKDSDSGNSGKNKKPERLSSPSKEGKKTYEQRLWEWLKTTGQDAGFVEWKEIKHPDYPDNKVEIGGFKPFVYTNPPRDSLVVMGRNFKTFMTKLSSWLPRTDINMLKVKHLHDNVYRISVVVQNQGYLSTNPQMGVPNKWCPKVKVLLELKNNQTLASGKVLNFIDILQGSGGSKEFNWLILGRKGETVKISAGSPMTGVIIKSIDLE